MRMSAILLAVLITASLWAAPVTDFGATGDDETNDTAAFVKAFEAGVKDLYVPPGTYVVGGLTLPGGTYLHGAGTASTLRLAPEASNILTMGANTRVTNLHLDGAGTGTKLLEGLIMVPQVRYVHIDHLLIDNSGRSAIVTDHADDLTIEHCRMENLASAVQIQFSHRIKVLNNTVLDCRVHGIQFWGNWKWEVKDCSDLLIQGNYCRDAGAGAIWGAGAVRVVANDNIVVNARDVGIDYEWCDDSVICGNTVTGAVNGGISLFFACKNVAITGNTIIIPDIEEGVRAGVWLTPTNRNVYKQDFGHRNITIVGNTIRAEGSRKLGISIGAESRDIVIAHNTLKNADIADNSEKSPPPEILALLERVTVLPAPVDWKFAIDADDDGVGGQWFAEGLDDTQWAPVRSGEGFGYETQGFEGYTGYSWYRAELQVSEDLNKQHLYLYFGAVDEQAWVYINGQPAFEHSAESTGLGADAIWDLPFASEISKLVRIGQSNLIAVRIHNNAGRGGLTRPVYLLASDEILTVAQMRLLVKAFTSQREDSAG